MSTPITRKYSLIEKTPIDYAYKAYLNETGNRTNAMSVEFNRWLWNKYQIKWDTGQMFDKDELVFYSEPHMTIFLLKFGPKQ